MSRYYKAKEVQAVINSLKVFGIPEINLDGLPTIEISEDNQVLYGTAHNCILTMFGECSYDETGCSDCAVAEKIRKALSVEVSEGEWLFEECPDGYYHSECSICKHWFIEDAFLKPYKYCPNCGSKMKGAEE